MGKLFNQKDNNFLEGALVNFSKVGENLGSLVNNSTLWLIKGFAIVLSIATFGLAFFLVAFVRHAVKGKKR